MSETTIQALEASLAEVQGKISAIIRGEGDASERDSLIDQANMLTNKIAEKEYELQQQQAKEQEKKQLIEEKVHAEGMPFAVSGVDFTKLPAELIEVIELVVKSDRRRIFAEHAIEIENVERERDEKCAALAQLQQKHETLEADYNNCRSELQEQTAETLRVITERDEARTNRDNAANQLEEARQEIRQLKSQVDDYQKAKVFGEREAQKIIETNADEAAAINDAIEKLYVSYENWGSINKVVKPDGSFELVKTRDLDQWAPIPAPELGGSESGESFRNENPTGDAGNSGIPASEVVGQVGGTFCEIEVPHDINSVEGLPTNGEVETQPSTVEERIAALEKAVFGKVNGAAA